MPKYKSLFDLEVNQTVNYPSRHLRVMRAPLNIYEDQNDYKFIAKRVFSDGRVMVSVLFVNRDSTDDFSTDVLLDMFEENAVRKHREIIFEVRMGQIKRGIRSNVRKHLRKKSARLLATA